MPSRSFSRRARSKERSCGRYPGPAPDIGADNLDRLIKLKGDGGHAEIAPNGSLVVRRSELGKFVAQNVSCDPNAISALKRPFGFATLLGHNIEDFSESAFKVVALKLEEQDNSKEVTQLLEDMVQIAVADNMIGSAGEFGWLMTFLRPSEATVLLSDDDPALAVRDITAMFAGEKVNGKYDPLTRHFPANSDRTPKTILNLVRHTAYPEVRCSLQHREGVPREHQLPEHSLTAPHGMPRSVIATCPRGRRHGRHPRADARGARASCLDVIAGGGRRPRAARAHS